MDNHPLFEIADENACPANADVMYWATLFKTGVQQLLRPYTFHYTIDTVELIQQANHAMQAAGFTSAPLIQVGAARINVQQFEMRMLDIVIMLLTSRSYSVDRQQEKTYTYT